MKTKIFYLKTLLLLFLLLEIGLSYAPITLAQTPNPSVTAPPAPSVKVDVYKGGEAGIKQYLCTPGAITQTGGSFVSSNGTDLFTCINNVYKFTLIVAGVIAIFFIVIAGYIYMYAGGNNESVEKAKSIVTSSVTSLVILFGAYVFLKALNPDLIAFQNIQPPEVVVANFSGYGVITVSQLPSGCTTSHCNLAGYDIGPYATGAGHEALVTTLYNQLSQYDFSTAGGIDTAMKSLVPTATIPINGQMVLSAAQSSNVDARLMLALMQADSHLGTQGLGANTHNPGNVGNTDSGAKRDFGSWQAGVNAVAQWLASHRAA